MDPVTSAIVGKVSEQIMESLFKFMGREIGYVVYCKQNIRKLGVALENLRVEMETVQRRVERALQNAEKIEPNVSKWLSDVGDMVKAMDQFLAADVANLLNCRCGCCPNIGLRHRLGKEADDMLMAALKLTEHGKFDSVGHQTPQIDTYLFTSTTDSQRFESRASVFNQIVDALQDDSVYTIGIYGMAGVGKTTMVDQLSKHAKDMQLFDEFAKAVVSQTPDFAKIQRDFAACLNLTLPKESQAQDASLLCSRLKIGKKILVIIDDVWDPIKLEEIGIPSRDYIKGCKIVFTSRIQNVYVQMDVQKQFPIGGLLESEAWSLFKNRVGNTIDDSHEIRSSAKQVCRECGGLPLAIITLGAGLKNKKLHQWNDTFNQLKSCRGNYINGMTEKVYTSIELSYKFLEHTDTKACFLYCSLYGEDEEICVEDLVQYGVGRRFLSSMDTVEAARQRVYTIVDTLKASCLLLEGSNEDYVRMHDIIRDVATSIAAKDEEIKLLVRSGGARQWPKEDELQCCRTFSSWQHSKKELPHVLECPELRTLVMRDGTFHFVAFASGGEIPHSLFKVITKLEILHLRGMGLLASSSSISKLVNIRMLCLYDCEVENLSFLKELEQLEILRIYDDKIAALTSEVVNLTQLRVLDLRKSDKLKTISAGIISSLSCLEELYLPDKFDNWASEGNARLEELNSLPCLHILQIHVPTVAKASLLLLHEPQCRSLIKFKISVGCHFNDFLEYSDTRTLKLEGIDLIVGPMALMKKAKALDLVGLKGLQKMFEERQRECFLDLNFLQVKNCNDEILERGFLLGKPKWNNPQIIEEGAGSSPSPTPFGKLNVLKVFDCRLKYLFSHSIARGLLQLQELVVSECDSMEKIVGDDDSDEQIGNEVLVFSHLKKLELNSLPNLMCFFANAHTNTAQPLFNQKVSFPALEKLSVLRLKSITTIWDIEFGAVSSLGLQWLKVSTCDKLVNVILSSTYSKLQDQQDGGQEMVILPKLETMRLRCLQNFKSFYSFKSNEEEMEDKSLQVNAFFSHKVSLPSLKRLYVWKLNSITTIWDIQFGSKGANRFKLLEELKLDHCDRLVHVVSSSVYANSQGDDDDGERVQFSKLKSVCLKSLLNIRSFYHIFRSREERMQKNIYEIQPLFHHKVKLPCQMKLVLNTLPTLREIWDVNASSDTFGKLAWLTIQNCNNLTNIAPSKLIKRFHSLRRLTIKNCLRLEEIFRSVEASNEMEERPTDEIENNLLLPQLKFVLFYDLPRLRRIYSRCSTSKVLSSVETLKIEGCSILEKD